MARLGSCASTHFKKKREEGDLIASGMDILDRNDLTEMERRRKLRGHGKKLRKWTCLKGINE